MCDMGGVRAGAEFLKERFQLLQEAHLVSGISIGLSQAKQARRGRVELVQVSTSKDRKQLHTGMYLGGRGTISLSWNYQA